MGLDSMSSNFGNVGNMGGMGGGLNLNSNLNNNNVSLNELMNMSSLSSGPSLSLRSNQSLSQGLSSSSLADNPQQQQQQQQSSLSSNFVGVLGNGEPAGLAQLGGATGDGTTSTSVNTNNNPTSTNTNPGIDHDILQEGAFPSVSWLRQYNMHMYRWAGDNEEWTEYAMHVPHEQMTVVLGLDPKATLQEISRLSHCDVWMDEELLGGSKEKFIVFLRGSSGKPSNAAMTTALELISEIMRRYVNSGGVMPSAGGGGGGILSKSAFKDGAFAGLDGGRGTGTLSLSDSSAFDSLVDPLSLDAKLSFSMKDRPELSKFSTGQGIPEYVQRSLEIPREVVGLIIGQSGKKIKELSQDSGAKIQFKVNKIAEREGRPGILEVLGPRENVDRGVQMIIELLHSVEKEKGKI